MSIQKKPVNFSLLIIHNFANKMSWQHKILTAFFKWWCVNFDTTLLKICIKIFVISMFLYNSYEIKQVFLSLLMLLNKGQKKIWRVSKHPGAVEVSSMNILKKNTFRLIFFVPFLYFLTFFNQILILFSHFTFLTDHIAKWLTWKL